MVIRHATYLLILAGCALGTLPLEFLLHTRVYARWRRLLIAVVPVAVVFTSWDLIAVRDGWWHYDPRQICDLVLPGRLPVEEVLFFLIIPVCAVLTLEAVRARRPGWLVGDEPEHSP
jgi:lycopene cyclase domain-containing protein